MIAQRTTAPGPARAAEAGDVETVSSEIIAQVGTAVQTDSERLAQLEDVIERLLKAHVTKVSA